MWGRGVAPPRPYEPYSLFLARSYWHLSCFEVIMDNPIQHYDGSKSSAAAL